MKYKIRISFSWFLEHAVHMHEFVLLSSNYLFNIFSEEDDIFLRITNRDFQQIFCEIFHLSMFSLSKIKGIILIFDKEFLYCSNRCYLCIQKCAAFSLFFYRQRIKIKIILSYFEKQSFFNFLCYSKWGKTCQSENSLVFFDLHSTIFEVDNESKRFNSFT